MPKRLFKARQDKKGHNGMQFYCNTLTKDMNLKLHITYNDKTYITHLLEWHDDEVTFEAPLNNLSWVALPQGPTLTIGFATKTAFYKGQMTILRCDKTEINYAYTAKLISPLEKLQQRSTYRIDVLLDGQFQCLSNESRPITPKLNCTIVNLSIGGMCFNTQYQHPAGTPIYVYFNFLHNDLELKGEILSVSDKLSSGNYSHRIRFVDLTNYQEDTLHMLIMEKQRLDLKKPKFTI